MAFFNQIAKQSGQMIIFTSIATGIEVEFPAFITQFSDSFSVGWQGDTPFGRVDPIKSYTSTTRRINAGFDILGHNRETAILNFEKFGKLIRMLYPVYSQPIGSGKGGKYRTIKASPLIRIRYANYIKSASSESGLLGCINGFDFNPDFKAGHFRRDNNDMVPLKYSLTFTFEPLHEKPLGFENFGDSSQGGDFLDQSFPYSQARTQTSIAVPGDDGRGSINGGDD